MPRRSFSASAVGGDLVGWVEGTGPPVLLLHGGPGLAYRYLDPLASELAPDYEVAAFQQRGLAPSIVDGPFTVAGAVDDVGRALDALGWEQAFVVGHSWGGHLLLHLAVAAPHRLLGALAVDPLGGVGDGGMSEFEATMTARTSEETRRRAAELDQRAMRGEGTDEDFIESLRLFWPAYFPPGAPVAEMPDIRTSVEAYSELMASLTEALPALAAALPAVDVPFGFVAGVESPMPFDASTTTAAVIPRAWVELVEHAGHFPWYDTPGRIRTALDRLVHEAGPTA